MENNVGDSPLDAGTELRDKIAAVVCAVNPDGVLEEPCLTLCTWCRLQADVIIKTIKDHEGKS
jgi:hypothetical protein